MGKDKAEVG